MNEAIEKMAREAGFAQVMRHKDGSTTILPDALFERFAQAVAKRCAEACLSRHANGNHKHDTREECAAAVLAEFVPAPGQGGG